MAPREPDPPAASDVGPVCSVASHADQELRDRLNAAWTGNDMRIFFGVAWNDLAPRIARYLVRMRGVTYEDGEECVNDVLQALEDMPPERRVGLTNPHGYIWSGAINAATDLLKGRQREADAAAVVREELARRESLQRPRQSTVDPEVEPPTGPVMARVAVYLTETLIDYIEVEEGWAVTAITVAVSRMPPKLQLVAQYILTHGPRVPAAAAQRDLSMKPSTYRSNKLRALARLRELLPVVIAELGINPAVLGPPDLGLTERIEFPSPEEDDQ
jgi:DNA-directed RNA polymerase specialized sigma24 family protein